MNQIADKFGAFYIDAEGAADSGCFLVSFYRLPSGVTQQEMTKPPRVARSVIVEVCLRQPDRVVQYTQTQPGVAGLVQSDYEAKSLELMRVGGWKWSPATRAV